MPTSFATIDPGATESVTRSVTPPADANGSDVLAANGFPHFTRGITKKRYPSQLGNGPIPNFVAGWALLVIAALLFYFAHVSRHPGWSLGPAAVGVLLMGLFHAGPGAFGRPEPPDAPRMDEHPLARFSDGPAGRRARLVGTGKDIWEIIAVVRDNDGDVAEAARYLEIPLGLVQAAIAYYGAYTAEIDQIIDLNEQETSAAHATFLAGQAALRQCWHH